MSAKVAVRHYHWFFAPALVVIGLVIVFPWVFTLYTAVHDVSPGAPMRFVGLENFAALFTDARFGWAIARTVYFGVLSVVFPVVLGVIAALVFHRRFRFRGIARTIFILPLMATPVAIALVWTMMFHPQVGVLNYLLTSVGLPPSTWVYSATTVIPTLAIVETWHWTPLVMLIVLGGLASLPAEPYEAARIDGATAWQTFRYVTLPMIWPFIVVCIVLRTIEAFKAFDLIYVITQGGPGSASETLNLYLYQTAFVYHRTGYASALVLVFFVVVVAVTLLMLQLKQRAQWR